MTYLPILHAEEAVREYFSAQLRDYRSLVAVKEEVISSGNSL